MSAPIFVHTDLASGPDRTLGILSEPVRCPACGVMAMLVVIRGASATCIPCDHAAPTSSAKPTTSEVR